MEIRVITPDNYEKQELPFFDEWIKALESGEYEQGRAFLCTNNKYCCLGILSKVQGRLTMPKDARYGIDGAYKVFSGLSSTNPCHKQLNYLGDFPPGVKVNVAIEKDNIDFNSLACCNDYGISFKDIANIIKQIWQSKNTTS
jgi:hypothetical protein